MDVTGYQGIAASANMAAEINSKMHDIQSKLIKKGWNIKSDEIEECIRELGQKQCNDEDVIKWAVNCDLKVIGSKTLAADVKRGQLQSIEGPVVLQIQKIRNISAPKANEESGVAPRLLKLQLTDGHTTCFALENSLIQKLSLSTLPGTKIRLKGTVPLISGFMLLEHRNVDVLGGEVEKLVVKWETNKNVSQQRSKPSMFSDDGPPLFMGFDTKTSGAVKKTSAAKYDNQKAQNSLPDKGESTSRKEENKKVHEDFEHSRHQRIQTAKQGNERHSNPTKNGNNAYKSLQAGGNQKMQPGSSGDRGRRRVESGRFNAPKPGETGHNQRDEAFSNKGGGQKYMEKSNRGRRPNSQRGGRHKDEYSDEHATSRPSDGTLWDFLETKLPSKGGKTEKGKTEDTAGDHLENDGNQYNRPPSIQRDGHYRNQRADQQEHGREKSSAGDRSELSGNQSVSKDHQQSKHANQRRYESKYEQKRNEEVNERSRKQSDHGRNQFAYPQKSEHQSREMERGALERFDNNQYNKEKQRGSDQRSQRNNPPPGTNSVTKHSKQAGKSYGNQSGHGGKDFSQEDKKKSDNYRKEYLKYDKADSRQPQSRGGTRQDSHAGNGSQDYRRESHDREKRGDVLRQRNYREEKTDTDVRPDREGVKTGKNSQQSRDKLGGRNPPVGQNKGSKDRQNKNEISGKSQTEKSRATPENSVISKGIKETHGGDSQMRETSARVGQSDNQKNNQQSQRYREGMPGGRSHEFRKQHWWTEGEDCLAFHVEHGQHYLAKITKVEVRHRSCVVMFHDTGKRETINWSNLVPLDFEATSQSFQFQTRGFPHTSSALMQEGNNKVEQHGTSFTPPPSTPPNFDEGWPEIQGSDAKNNAMRTQRPTQAFYQPPRGAMK